METWARSIHGVLGWAPEHLSAYGLTLDAGSVWASTGIEGLPAEGAVVEQYWTLARAAAARGFEHYEISNYARAGFRSRHNQIYWRAAGIVLPKHTGDQRRVGLRVARDAVEPGDLLFFKSRSENLSHVAVAHIARGCHPRGIAR